MKVLITGGAGFIGSDLARFLLDGPQAASVRPPGVIDQASAAGKLRLAA